MKKLSIIFAVFLLTATFGMARAELEWEDPALCVAGQWLLVDAAHPEAVWVTVPAGTAYGDQAEGGCTTPAPAALIPNSAVTAKGGGSKMTVIVDGAEATSPVLVRYGGVTQTHPNHGDKMKFKFDLD